MSHCVCGLAGFSSIAYPLYVFPAIADISKDNEKSLRIGMVMAGQGVALTLGPLIGAYTKAVTSAKARPVPAPLPREPALRLAPLSYARALTVDGTLWLLADGLHSERGARGGQPGVRGCVLPRDKPAGECYPESTLC